MSPLKVSGEYAIFTIRLTAILPAQGLRQRDTADGDQYEAELLSVLQGSDLIRPLRQQLDQVIKSQLGSDINLDSLHVREGSVELILVATTAYKLVTNFNEVLDNLQKTAERLRQVLRAFTTTIFGSRAPAEAGIDVWYITAMARPGTALQGAKDAGGSEPRLGVLGLSGSALLVVYLALSNLALIIGLLVFLTLSRK
jgi:hypothetical protein